MTRKDTHSAGQRLLRTLKWLVPLAVIVGLVALAFIPKPVTVDIGKVSRGAMMLTVDDDGETRVRERYAISTPLAGRLLRIELDPGDEVMQGDVLATIDPGMPNLLDPRARAQAEALVNAATASISSAQTQFEARKVETDQLAKAYQRTKLLHDKGNVADATFEQSESAYLAAKHAEEAAASAVQITRFELEQAKAALLRTHPPDADSTPKPDDWNFVIRAPIDGRILRVHEESSRIVQSGTPLLELADASELEMRIDVLSQDAVKIKPGQKVFVEHWGGTQQMTGRVRLVEPSAYTKVSALGVDEQRVNVIADFETRTDDLDGAEGPGDGYRIEARIVIWESTDSVQVPAGALFRELESWAVYRMDGNHARLAKIEIGRNNGEFAEVLSGLNAGDAVILHPGERIEEGTLIKPRS